MRFRISHQEIFFTALMLVAFSVMGPLTYSGAAHRSLDTVARAWSVVGGPVFGLDLTMPRQNIFSLGRDLRRTITIADHGKVQTSHFFGLINFARRGGTWTVADVLRSYEVTLTTHQARAADLCRPLNINTDDYTITIKPDPYQYGIASWYGPGFDGRLAASGEIYDMYEMTAAHRTLPLHSVVRVTAVRTGKSIIVRINDRGPYVAGRNIDLSYRAKQELGMQGLAANYIERLDLDALNIDCK